ncbi:MAG: hypothetical protein QOG71_477 [Pyrinomonadaceae bacterium]|nr:hypothetical protein [Pyrinomonadaceae bacterium]
MSWTSVQATQNGNTTLTYTISGSALSVADDVVIRGVSGSSGIRLNSVTLFLKPTRYKASVSIIGTEQVKFKFSAEEMD